MRPGPSPFALLRSARLARSGSLTIVSQNGARRTIMTPPEIPPPPPLSQRLKGILPFLFWWSVITSLAAHRLRMRHEHGQEMGVVQAKISVLESLVERVKGGSELTNEQVRKEMEMVGLRERTSLTEDAEGRLLKAADVNWREALLGRKNRHLTPEEGEREAVEEWSKSESHVISLLMTSHHRSNSLARSSSVDSVCNARKNRCSQKSAISYRLLVISPTASAVSTIVLGCISTPSFGFRCRLDLCLQYHMKCRVIFESLAQFFESLRSPRSPCET